jgi:hypothetical protein
MAHLSSWNLVTFNQSEGALFNQENFKIRFFYEKIGAVSEVTTKGYLIDSLTYYPAHGQHC